MLRLFKNPRKVMVQMGAAASASLSFMIMGMVRAWSSPGMPSLLDSKAVPLTESDVSWISSIPPLASLVGSLVAGPCLTYLGRRRTLMLISIPYSLGFLLIGFASHSSMLYIGRILDGAMIGFSAPSAQIFIGECASPRVRGALGAFTAIFLSLGILITYVIGAFVPWNVLAWILSAFPALLFGAMYLMPETPSWLLSNNREEEAKKSLQFLRGAHTDITGEFERLKANLAKGANSQQIQPRELLKGSVLKPLLLSMALMLLQQFSGINSIIYFTVFIFQKAGSTMDKNLSTIIVGIVQLLATIASMFLVDRAGRRLLLLVSGVVMAISLAALGAFFYMLEVYGNDVQLTLGWLPLASLLLFIIAYSSGFANVPFLIMGELFPAKFRSILGSLASCFNLLCTFTIIRSFGDMNKTMGEYGTFWFYMSWCVVGVFFVYFFLPETKGKSFEEIERMFANKKKQQLYAAGAETTIGAAADKNDVFTVETIPRAHIDERSSQSHSNDGYDMDSDEEDNGEVVATPL